MAKTKQNAACKPDFKKTIPPDQNLTSQQKKACQMLFDGKLVSDTAKSLGVHRSTIWRWGQKSAFRREWRRLNHNARRRSKRHIEKLISQQEALWQQNIKATEENLQKAAENIKDKPTKAFDAAYNAYRKALFCGISLSQIFDWTFSGDPFKIKLQR